MLESGYKIYLSIPGSDLACAKDNVVTFSERKKHWHKKSQSKFDDHLRCEVVENAGDHTATRLVSALSAADDVKTQFFFQAENLADCINNEKCIF